MTKRWRLAFPKPRIRFGWLALLALTAQLIVIYVGFGDAGVIRRFVFPSSLVLLLVFVLLNRRYAGLLIASVGILLNLLPVVANGGLMPVSPANLEKAGYGDDLADLDPGDPVPRTKNVLLDEDETRLQLLSDRLVWRALGPFPLFSIGDVVIAGAFVVILGQLLLPMVLRPPQDQPSET